MGTKRHDVRWLMLHLALWSCGCGSYVVTPSPMPTTATPSGAARVCVVRQGADGAVATYPLKDNGILVGATLGGSCFCYFAAEGKHELEARSDGFDTLDVDVKGGSDVFILQTTQAAVGIVRSRLERVDPDTGKAALASCQYSVLTEVPEGAYKAKPNAVVVAK